MSILIISKRVSDAVYLFKEHSNIMLCFLRKDLSYFGPDILGYSTNLLRN